MLEATSICDGFIDIDLERLETLSSEETDMLPYGVVALDQEGLVVAYNRTEARLAGLPAASVIGSHFFLSIAQCMNNFMVAQRFEDEKELDTVINYMLTFRMRPTPVRLRLLQGAAASRRWILVDRSMVGG